MPVIQAQERLTQEDREFEASMAAVRPYLNKQTDKQNPWLAWVQIPV
jgi:hypothetical protein